jgi:hypothetical protein
VSTNLNKVEDIITNILGEHRKAFPAFFLFSDQELLKIITDTSHENIEQAAKRLLPGLLRIEF